MIKKLITVEGMHCSHCAATVERAIGEIAGVSSAKVNLDKSLCTVKLSNDIEDTVFKAAVKEAGFEVKSIETKKGLF